MNAPVQQSTTTPQTTARSNESLPISGSNTPSSPKPSALDRGVKVLLEGPTGTGKTHSIGTLVDYGAKHGIEVFYMCFESPEALLGYWTDFGKPVPKNLHIHQVQAGNASFVEMAASVKQVNTLSYETLKKITDPNRSKYDQYEKFLLNFNQVRDDQTGQTFGCVDNWGLDRALVVDHLTGLDNACMKAVIGGKADRDQKDWGLAQNLEENLLRKLTADCRCHFFLAAHVERETDMILGGVKLTVSTLGKALPPKLPPMFSDVVLTVRNGATWFWDTANPQADLKTRNLPIGDKIKPDFAQILDKWRSRGGLFVP